MSDIERADDNAPASTPAPAPAIEQIRASTVDPELDRALVDELGEPVILVDGRGVIVRVNREAEILLGYPRLELLGQSVDVLVPASRREAHAGHRDRYMTFPQPRQMGAAQDLDLAVLTKPGREIPVRISLKPLVVSSGRYVSAVIRLREETRG